MTDKRYPCRAIPFLINSVDCLHSGHSVDRQSTVEQHRCILTTIIMFVSVRYNEVEPHSLSHSGQYLQPQQQQQSPAATEWTSCYRTSSNHHQHFQHSAPMLTAPYLDYCNAVLPVYSCRQLNKISAVHGHGCWRPQATTSASGVATSSSQLWTGGVNSTCYANHDRPADVRRVAHTAATRYTNNEMNWVTQQPVRASNNYQLLTAQTETTSYGQHQSQVVWPSSTETVSRGAQRCSSAAGEFQTSSSTTHQSHGRSELVHSPSAVQHGQPRKTKEALVPLIIRAILSSADMRMSLADICRYIEQHSVDYARLNDETRWHNNVRHTLSHYEFFVKSGRVPTGRGNYWTVHPVCRAAFTADDFRIKRARHAVQVYEKSVNKSASAALHQHSGITDRPH